MLQFTLGAILDGSDLRNPSNIVYIVGAGRKTLYIGQTTTTLRKRMIGHANDGRSALYEEMQRDPTAARQWWVYTLDLAEYRRWGRRAGTLDEMERQLIQEYHPALNVQHNGKPKRTRRDRKAREMRGWSIGRWIRHVWLGD